MSTLSSRLLIKKMILVSIFIALSFIGTFIEIPLPTGDFIHLGNFFSLLGGLLVGPFLGGISGSIGMGLYDLIFYPSYVIRTIILKFLMTFITAFTFNQLKKSNKKPLVILLILLVISLGILIFNIVNIIDPIEFVYNDQIQNITISITLLTLSIIIFLMFLMATIFYRKISQINQILLVSVTLGVAFNIIAEFVIRIVLDLIIGIDFFPAFLYSIFRTPASIITGIITIIMILFIYQPVYKAISHYLILNKKNKEHQ